jgi:hypothetical protein
MLPPASGAGARMAGSTPEGGHSTPFDFANFSPSDWPVVDPCGAAVPRGGAGAQSIDAGGAGGAVCTGGVAGDNGACARVTPHSASSSAIDGNKECIIRMKRKRFLRALVPEKAPN